MKLKMVEKEWIPFRDAYVKVGDNLATIQPADFLENIRSKKSLGSPGNLGWEYYDERMAQFPL